MLKMVNCRHLLGTGGRAYICTHKLRDETTFSKQRQGSCQFIFSLWQSVSVPNKVANVINSAIQFECDFVLKTANSLVVISFSFSIRQKKTLRLHCESNILTFNWKQCFCFDSNTNLKIASNRIILWISIQQSSHFIVKIKLEFKQFHPLFSMNRRSTKQVNRFTITNRIQILIHISHLNLEFAFIIHWTSNPWTGPIYVKYS